MKFRIFRTSNEKPNVGETQIVTKTWIYDDEYEIEIDTLQELIDIISKSKNTDEIVVGYEDNKPFIEIYDGWRE